VALIRTREWIDDRFLAEIEAAGDRAVSAGASEPLRYLGIGMTGVVFQGAEGHAWKCGRSPDRRFIQEGLREEYEFLRDACRVPSVARNVACAYRFRMPEVVIERECPMPRSDERRHYDFQSKGSHRMWETHQRIQRLMEPYGWRGIEFKEDSYVVTADRGPVLVDASNPIRVGWPYVRYVQDILSGIRDLQELEPPTTLAWGLRADASDGRIPKDVAETWIRKLQRTFPGEDWRD